MPAGPELDTRIDPQRREWRPQEALLTRRPEPIANPILEPLWEGVRVLAHFRAGDDDKDRWLVLLDIDGTEVSHLARRAADELRDRIMAHEAVVDGILTEQTLSAQPSRPLGVGPEVPNMSPMSLFLPRRTEVLFRPPHSAAEVSNAGFVAFDLLSIDDQPLLDLPLLERKRLLDGLFTEDELVRISPYVRPPIGPWFSSWKSAGFRGVMMKAANSRYVPGDFSAEWVEIERLPRG
jgi:hypothetical protein